VRTPRCARTATAATSKCAGTAVAQVEVEVEVEVEAEAEMTAMTEMFEKATNDVAWRPAVGRRA